MSLQQLPQAVEEPTGAGQIAVPILSSSPEPVLPPREIAEFQPNEIELDFSDADSSSGGHVPLTIGKLNIVENPGAKLLSWLADPARHDSIPSKIKNPDVRVADLYNLPFEASSVTEALRKIGIPETRIRQLLHQIGLKSLADAPPQQLSADQMRILSLLAALHSRERTVIFQDPFRGIDPALARKMSDFMVVTALEQKKTFLLVQPGKTVEHWRDQDWASWQEPVHRVNPQQRFGEMNLNVPQELLELQMARNAMTATREVIQKKIELPDIQHGVKFLKEKLQELKIGPFLAHKKDEQERFRNLNQNTKQDGTEGIFLLPGMRRGKQIPLPFQLRFSNGTPSDYSRHFSIFILGLAVAGAFVCFGAYFLK